MSEPTVGHNQFSKDQLQAIIERIESQVRDKDDIAAGIRDIYTEAKSNGYCCKTLRKVVAMRKKNPSDRAEEAALMETYLHALGME